MSTKEVYNTSVFEPKIIPYGGPFECFTYNPLGTSFTGWVREKIRKGKLM